MPQKDPPSVFIDTEMTLEQRISRLEELEVLRLGLHQTSEELDRAGRLSEPRARLERQLQEAQTKIAGLITGMVNTVRQRIALATSTGRCQQIGPKSMRVHLTAGQAAAAQDEPMVRWFRELLWAIKHHGGRWIADPEQRQERLFNVLCELGDLSSIRWAAHVHPGVPIGPADLLVGCSALLVHLSGNAYPNGSARGFFLTEVVTNSWSVPEPSGSLEGAIAAWGYICFELSHVGAAGAHRLGQYRMELQHLRSLAGGKR